MSERYQRATGLFRAGPNRRGSAYWRIGVPKEIALAVRGVQFTCELTDEGILYRPAAPAPAVVPAWLGDGVEAAS